MSDESKGKSSKNTLYCSFCNKSQYEVCNLLSGPTAFICDECVELCTDIIREEVKQTKKPDIKDLNPGDKYPIHFGVEMPDIAVTGKSAPQVADIIADLDIKQIGTPKQLEAAIAWLIIGLAREEILAQVEVDLNEVESKLEQVRATLERAGPGTKEEIGLFVKEATISIQSGLLSDDEMEQSKERRQRLEEHIELFDLQRRLTAHFNYLESYRSSVLKAHPAPEEDESETAAQ